MAIGLKKPDDVAGAAWPAIAIGLFVAFVSCATSVNQKQLADRQNRVVYSSAMTLAPSVVYWR
jgi:hypothetical protein